MLTAQDIRELRESLGLSREQLAIRLDCSVPTIASWELGNRHPRWDTMVKLNELLAEARAASAAQEPVVAK